MRFQATFDTVPGHENSVYLFRLVDLTIGELATAQVPGDGNQTVVAVFDVPVSAQSSLYAKCFVAAPPGGWQGGDTAPEGQTNTLNVDPRPMAPDAPTGGSLASI